MRSPRVSITLLVVDLLLRRRGFPQVNVKVNELGVFTNDVVQARQLHVLARIFLENETRAEMSAEALLTVHRVVSPDCRSSTERIPAWIFEYLERGRVRLPDILIVVVVLRSDNDLVGDEKARIEAHAELSNQIVHRCSFSVLALSVLHSIEKFRRVRFRYRAKELDEISARHSDARVRDEIGRAHV